MRTLCLEVGKSPKDGVVQYFRDFLNLAEYFEYIGFKEMPPLAESHPRIVRPWANLKTPFYDMSIFEVNFGSDEKPIIGLMSRHSEPRGSVVITRVNDGDQEKYVFLRQKRFLFEPLLETPRGFDPVKKELHEELDFSGGDPEPKQIGTVRINTGISMTKSAEGDIPIYLVDVKLKPKVGAGEKTERLLNIELLTRAQIREKYLAGEITDPWFMYALGLIDMLERPQNYTEEGRIVLHP